MTTLARTLVDRLREVVPADRVIDDPASLAPYAYDASFWSLRNTRLPDVVVIPDTSAEVQAVVRIAAETGTPIVARRAGTGQTDGARAARGEIVVALAAMPAILEICRSKLAA